MGSKPQRYRLIEDLLDLWRHEVEDAELNTRGWVVQERLLAPRVLHFGRNQILWECRDQYAAEIYPEEISPDFWKMPTHMHFDAPYEDWSRIVSRYSRCSLTKKSDKLIAVSGLAKQVGSRLNDEYVAGMWRQDLAIQLFWSTRGFYGTPVCGPAQSIFGKRPSKRAQPYRAPSFSWAATDAEIRYSLYSAEENRHSIIEAVEVVDVQLEHVTKDTYGAVSGGYLDLRCFLKKLFLPSGQSPWGEQNEDLNGMYGVIPDSYCDTFRRLFVFLDDYPEYFNPVGREDVYCVPAYLAGSRRWDCLLLQVVDADEGIFRRFGLGCVDLQGEEADNGARFSRQCCSRAASYPCRSFDGERHVIRII
ncbi:Hypothetical predicted protein [Lecanosticta acicola]|uniref:Uncharacterized protein n=1 Tax=Lecanosticta acicola TaxID=111012 RepID=A0AAI8YU82_9PEZI|nr:Hypothetical predicted protein [Lecanosticta acicola]